MATPNTSLANLFAQRAARDAARASVEDVRVAMIEKAGQASSLAAFKNNGIVFNKMIEQKQGKMWIIEDFEKLEGRFIGSGQCPGIVQTHDHVPLSKYWIEGPKVMGNPVIPWGTAVATFENSGYQNKSHGNHVAIYLGQDPFRGVLVFDQWISDDPKHSKPAGKRWLPFKDKEGVIDRSNNGAAFPVILTPK